MTTANQSTTSNSKVLPVAAGLSAAAAFAYYSTTTAHAETKATLTGGDEWVDLKVKEAEDLSHNVSTKATKLYCCSWPPVLYRLDD
jgi:hypothetical protein